MTVAQEANQLNARGWSRELSQSLVQVLHIKRVLSDIKGQHTSLLSDVNK